MHGGLWREDLFGGISEFSVQAQLLSVDMECAIDVTSFGEPECQTTEETSLETSIAIVVTFAASAKLK